MPQIESESYTPWLGDSVTPSLQAPFFPEHLARYFFASSLLKGKSVIDLGCGKGYGSYALAQGCKSVVGIDLNFESLEFAKNYYKHPVLKFELKNITAFSGASDKVDAIVAFETIEHIYPHQTHKFLDEILKALKPGGLLLLSTPNHRVVSLSGMPVPDFHINNLNPHQLKALLDPKFKEVTMYGQVKSQGPFLDVILLIDRFNLRHSVPIKLLRKSGHKLFSRHSDFRKAESNSLSQKPWTLEDGWGSAENYFFSELYWRQSGLTFAICRK